MKKPVIPMLKSFNIFGLKKKSQQSQDGAQQIKYNPQTCFLCLIIFLNMENLHENSDL